MTLSTIFAILGTWVGLSPVIGVIICRVMVFKVRPGPGSRTTTPELLLSPADERLLCVLRAGLDKQKTGTSRRRWTSKK